MSLLAHRRLSYFPDSNSKSFTTWHQVSDPSNPMGLDQSIWLATLIFSFPELPVHLFCALHFLNPSSFRKLSMFIWLLLGVSQFPHQIVSSLRVRQSLIHTWEAASHSVSEHGLWRWTSWAQVQHDPYVSQGRLAHAPLTDHSQMYSLNTAKVCLFAHAECPTQDGSRPIIIMVTQKPRLVGGPSQYLPLW